MITKDTTFIYALIDPISQDVRYVGKSDDPWNRLHIGNKIHIAHLKDASHTHKAHWIQSLKRKNLVPILVILEQCKKDVWQEREKDWIVFYRKLGYKLTNGTDGGDGSVGHHLSEEAKIKIKEASIKRWENQELKAKMIKKLSQTKKAANITLSEETKRLMSESHKGKVSPNKDKKLSEETKRLMSESHKGNIPYNKNKKLSKEVCKNIRRQQKKMGKL